MGMCTCTCIYTWIPEPNEGTLLNYILPYFEIFIFIYLQKGGKKYEYICVMVHMYRLGQKNKNLVGFIFFPSPMWDLGIELKSLHLAASPLTP